MSEREARGGRREARIDAAIDGAVREMLDVEQRAGFRGRVLRRIEGDSPVASAFRRKDLFRRKIMVLAPLAAAAVLVLAVLLPRMREQQAPQAPVTTTVTTQPQNPVVVPPATTTVPGPRTAPSIEPRTAVAARRTPQPASASTPRPDRVVAASFEPAEAAGPAIAPLKTIESIRVAPLAEHTIAPEAITVRALTPMNELQIAPLTPPGGRN